MNNTTATVHEITVVNGKIYWPKKLSNGKYNLPNGTYRLVEIPEETKPEIAGENFDSAFKLVEASKLSLDDEFMSYEPKTKWEKNLKKLLQVAIKRELPDFYAPIYAPSFSRSGKIRYVPIEKPAVDKGMDYWKRVAKEFNPDRLSQSGTRLYYAAFLGVLIKRLIAEKDYSIEAAWNAVCNDSKELGHYRDSEKAIDTLEVTGSREICGFYDLGNTYKYLEDDDENNLFWIGGGACNCFGSESPLAELHSFNFVKTTYSRCVGWIIYLK